MKIVTLVENQSLSDNLTAQHGLSLYIETENHKILFDTGQTNLFIQNAEKLNIDLAEVDIAVISHAHYDHTGGLSHFLKINQKATVYLKKQILGTQYFSIRGNTKKEIGASPISNEYQTRFRFLECAFLPVDNLYFISNFDINYPFPKSNTIFFKRQGINLFPDDFSHELIFVVDNSAGMSVFSGCSHNGILNIISTVQRFLPDKIISNIFGGFHLIDKNEFSETETDDEIEFIAREMSRIAPEAQHFTGHCTGINAYKILSNVLKTKIQKFETGFQTEL
jgi:7,8-dihydropterin-6-yl-methyl-4-(beta-D-ribofuranosyl)aminobenzene 5'-phosphate synthase